MGREVKLDGLDSVPKANVSIVISISIDKYLILNVNVNQKCAYFCLNYIRTC